MSARAALATLFGAASADGASTPRAHLLYVREAGAERCPDEAEVRGVVTGRLGYDPFLDGALNTVSVTLQRAPHGCARASSWSTAPAR